MKAIRNAVLAVVALAIFMTLGCGRHSSSEVYYMIVTRVSLPYWQSAAAGFNKAAAQYNVKTKIVGPENYDPQAQLSALHQAIAAKPAGILISVSEISVLQPEIDAASAAGIPILTFDSDAVGSRRLYFIGTNNVEAGRLGAQRVIQKLGGKGNVVFFSMPDQPNLDDRLKGFKEVFATRPNMHIVDVVDMKGDPRYAFDWAQESLSLTGDKRVDAYVSLESASGKVVADALKREKVTDRLLIAWDVDPETLSNIKDGSIDSTVAQKPYTMGFYGLKALDEIHHALPKSLTKDYSGDSFAPYPVFVDTGASVVDKSNVDRYIAAAADQSK